MNIDLLREAIRPLDLTVPFIPSAEEQLYLNFYGLHFQHTMPTVEQYFGYIACNDQRIACHYFANHNATRTCFVVHGYMDHAGLFGKVIDYLLHRGCNVVAMDFPGHGLSTGTQASIDSFGDYVLVLRQCLEFFYQKTTTPWHVVAQSTGGAVVMDYLLSQQYDETTGPFDKVLLLAPLVRPKKWLSVRILHWLLKGFVSSIKRPFSANSHDADFVRFMQEEDPLQTKRMPLQWISAMLQWEKRFRTLSWSEMEILVVQGEGDQTVDWKHNLKIIQEKFPQAKQFRIKNARHHLAREDQHHFERVTQAADIYFDRRNTPRD